MFPQGPHKGFLRFGVPYPLFRPLTLFYNTNHRSLRELYCICGVGTDAVWFTVCPTKEDITSPNSTMGPEPSQPSFMPTTDHIQKPTEDSKPRRCLDAPWASRPSALPWFEDPLAPLHLKLPSPGFHLGPPNHRLSLGYTLPHVVCHSSGSAGLSCLSGSTLVNHQPGSASDLRISSFASTLHPSGSAGLLLPWVFTFHVSSCWSG